MRLLPFVPNGLLQPLCPLFLGIWAAYKRHPAPLLLSPLLQSSSPSLAKPRALQTLFIVFLRPLPSAKPVSLPLPSQFLFSISVLLDSSPVFPFALVFPAITPLSTMGKFRKRCDTPEKMAAFRHWYQIPDNVGLRLNGPDDTYQNFTPGFDHIHIPVMAVAEGGVRFPLSTPPVPNPQFLQHMPHAV